MTESTAVLRRVHDLLELLPEAPTTARRSWPEETPEELAAWQRFLDTTENLPVEPCPFLDGVPDTLPKRQPAAGATTPPATAAAAAAATEAVLPTVPAEDEVADDAIDVAEVPELDPTTGERPAIPDAGGEGRNPAAAALQYALDRPRTTAKALLVACALLAVLAFVLRDRGEAVADPAPAPVAAAEVATTTGAPTPSTEAPSTTVPAPTSSVTTGAQAREAFLRTMAALGLTPDQSECAATKVEATAGWDLLNETALTPEGAQHLRTLVESCVVGA